MAERTIHYHEGTSQQDPTCVDLVKTFGTEFKITWDEAYTPFNVPKDKLDVWYVQIACERGVIWPYGRDQLAVEIDYRPVTARAVAQIPGVRLYQNGDHEKTFLFPVELFDQVAAIVKPRKRRKLTEEHKAKLAGSMTAEERAAAAAKGKESQMRKRIRRLSQGVGEGVPGVVAAESGK